MKIMPSRSQLVGGFVWLPGNSGFVINISCCEGVNSGVMLMNLTRMREAKWKEHILPYFKKYRFNITWGDQDLINIFFHFHPGQCCHCLLSLYTINLHWFAPPGVECGPLSVCGTGPQQVDQNNKVSNNKAPNCNCKLWNSLHQSMTICDTF